MFRTPCAASLSRIATTPLSKAGLLLSPAISTTRQRSAGTTPPAGAAATSLARADGGGVPAASGVQAATDRVAKTTAATRTIMPGYSNAQLDWGLAPTARNAMSA